MHLTELEIASFIEKKSNGKQRKKVLNHLNNCQKCYDEFAECFDIFNNPEYNRYHSNSANFIKKAENLVGNVHHAKNHFKKKRKFGTKYFALAFTIAAFGISILLFQTKIDNTNIKYRSANSLITLRLFTPEDLAVTNSKQLNFRWSSIRETNYYILKISDEVGNTVLEKSTKNIHIKLTGKTKLVIGKKYLWQVQSILNNGEKIASKLYAFTYKK